MHNSFIFQQYVCYTTLLNMFRAARCSSSGGQIVSPQPLVSSPSVNSSPVCRWRADSFWNYQLNAQFLYFSTICMLHYAPQHVSSSTLLIFRRTNCITTASGIVTLHKQPYSVQVESGLQSALHLHTGRLFTEGDDTRGCSDTICSPEDEQRAARNMLRSVV